TFLYLDKDIVIPCWGTRALIPKVICEVHAQTLTPSMFEALHVQLWIISNQNEEVMRRPFQSLNLNRVDITPVQTCAH
ncbi:hypothetical protein BpHYR1_048053, partial [Brachionus plicatilis]